MSKLELKYTDEWGGLYWAYNVPLQAWPLDDGSGYRILNYMARRERCEQLEAIISHEDAPTFFANAATVLRNLADQFDALAAGKCDYVYYPDADPLTDNKLVNFEGGAL